MVKTNYKYEWNILLRTLPRVGSLGGASARGGRGCYLRCLAKTNCALSRLTTGRFQLFGRLVQCLLDNWDSFDKFMVNLIPMGGDTVAPACKVCVLSKEIWPCKRGPSKNWPYIQKDLSPLVDLTSGLQCIAPELSDLKWVESCKNSVAIRKKSFAYDCEMREGGGRPPIKLPFRDRPLLPFCSLFDFLLELSPYSECQLMDWTIG